MLRQGIHILFACASVIALSLSAVTPCRASLIAPAPQDFSEDHLLAAECNDGADDGDMSSESSDTFEHDRWPADMPGNPIRLTARKGLGPTGSSSSTGSSSAPSSGASGVPLCDIAADPATVNSGEQSARLYAATTVFLPSAVQARLFRPPRLS